MYKPDQIAGLAANLPALGQHLSFQLNGQEGKVGAPAREPVSQIKKSSPRREDGEAIRADMLRDISRELAELSRAIEGQRLPGVNSPQLAALEQKAGELQALRDRIDGAQSPALLAQLRHQVAETVRTAADATQTAQGSLAASSGAITTRQMAEAVYNTRMAAIEKSMGAIMQRDAQGFREADAFARAHGVDGKEFTGARGALEDVADAHRKKGDRVGGVVADALNSQNTADYWEKIAKETGSEEAQKKAEQHRTLAERADREARGAVRSEVEREAADRGMKFDTPEAHKGWTENETTRRHNKRKIEILDEAVATGKMSPKRAQEMKDDILAGVKGFKDVKSDLFEGRSPSEASGMAEQAATPYQAVVVTDKIQNRNELADKFADASASPAHVPGLDASVHAEAKKVAAPVAQDTSKAEHTESGQKTPSATPAKIADASAGKSSITI